MNISDSENEISKPKLIRNVLFYTTKGHIRVPEILMHVDSHAGDGEPWMPIEQHFDVSSASSILALNSNQR